MGRFIDLTGQKFGRLTVIERAENDKDSKARWKCKCDCNNEVIVSRSNLKLGGTKSCGCYTREISSKRLKTHGGTNTRLYHIWSGMKQRCYYTKNRCYKTYGLDGITVCEEWKNDFQTFYDWAMDNGYKEDLTIDRIDNGKGYCPDNCRWVDNKEQQNNKRTNYLITYNGKTQSASKWAKEYGINSQKLIGRIKLGWDIEKALGT